MVPSCYSILQWCNNGIPSECFVYGVFDLSGTRKIVLIILTPCILLYVLKHRHICQSFISEYLPLFCILKHFCGTVAHVSKLIPIFLLKISNREIVETETWWIILAHLHDHSPGLVILLFPLQTVFTKRGRAKLVLWTHTFLLSKVMRSCK
jgi:hypothetical protein